MVRVSDRRLGRLRCDHVAYLVEKRWKRLRSSWRACHGHV